MLDAPDPVGDFPFALFVGRRFEDGSVWSFYFCFVFLFSGFRKSLFLQHNYYNTDLSD